MAGELFIPNISGLSVYGQVRNSTARRWSGAQFEAYNSSHYSLYASTLTEQGVSGTYVGDFPIGITTSGHYEVIYYAADTPGIPTEGDRVVGTSSLDWTGTAITTVPPIIVGAMSGSDWYDYVVRAFKRTDKVTEVFDATKDSVDEMRRRIVFPGDEQDGDTTDTITVLGDYRIALEGDMGHFLGAIVLIDGNFGYTLRKISKGEYDRKYSGFGTGASSRGRPAEFAIFGGNILLGPVPDKTTYGYRQTYAESDLASYDSRSPSIPFTDKYRETTRWGTLQRLYSDILKNDDQAAKFGTLYENGLKIIERTIDRDRKAPTMSRYRGF